MKVKCLKIALKHDIEIFGKEKVKRLIGMLSGSNRIMYDKAYLEVINGK